tara:strand:+ start:288 stop:485 length:198 start_codon:yes stop_codon:yes gene_type:complete
MVISRQAKNQRQLAESVRNKLKNLLKTANLLPKDFDHLVVKISDLEEMYGDMEQLNHLRLTNNTW